MKYFFLHVKFWYYYNNVFEFSLKNMKQPNKNSARIILLRDIYKLKSLIKKYSLCGKESYVRFYQRNIAHIYM